MEKSIKLIFPKFPTHVKISKSKSMKLGYNKIYAGVNHFVREKTIRQIHEYVNSYIPKDLTVSGPIKTHLHIYVPINFGSVRFVKGELSWKAPDKSYKPNWDLDNLSFIWLKCLNDGLVKCKIIPDDTVEYLVSTSYTIHFINSFEDRKLVYEIRL